jgi:predicted PolB exonuclease-like 3'-5' exonuclease
VITLVVDIETVGGGTPEQQEAIVEMAAAREMDPAAFAALTPPLARVVCVGLKQLETGKAIAYAALLPDGERHVLEQANAALSKATRLVTFNGRCFDLVVLIHRSIINGVTPAPKLVAAAREYRYRPNVHIDVRDQFTFFGASSGGTLRAFCLGYGIGDPKAHGSGNEVAALVEAGKLDELKAYCLGDVEATAVLYQRWLAAVGVGA